MSARETGAVIALLGVAGALVVWTLFGYAVMIAAFVALTGPLKVAMGVYIVGSILLFAATLFTKSLRR